LLITGKTHVCAIIGDPVEHSLSPVMHNAAFTELGIDCVYVPFIVLPGSLGNAVQGLRSQSVIGFNVTFPYKIEIVKYVHKLNPTARLIGAVNTVVNAEGNLVGHNTDGIGAIKALAQNGIDLNNSTFTILGAGGASRAIVFSLAKITSRIQILNRTLEKAQKLKLEVKRKLHRNILAAPLTKRSLAQALSTTDVLVNATSVGANADARNQFIEGLDLDRKITVFDIVYGRSETGLLRKAKQKGCRTISGIEMLLHQGASAFELWTGRIAPIDIMRRALASAQVR
jgi:shikimate dehydrogenase